MTTHPELMRRFNMLVERMWSNGWEVWISSSTRSRKTQEDLFRRWRLPAGHPNRYAVPSVANPWAVGSKSPWGWRTQGSYHMPQADGYSHALDIGWRGCTDDQAQRLIRSCGMWQTVANEKWHCQFWNGQHTYAIQDDPLALPEKDEDMPKLVQCDDGDIAVFLTDGVIKTWVQDGNAQVELRDKGFVEAALNGHPHLLSRSAINSFALVGPAPRYDALYAGPRTTA